MKLGQTWYNSTNLATTNEIDSFENTTNEYSKHWYCDRWKKVKDHDSNVMIKMSGCNHNQTSQKGC
jgi:hypothetical protein